MQEMVNILLNAMETWIDGYDNAYSSAASNITGTGVSIWTNSLSRAMIYSALEASTLKKQANKADKQFGDAMRALSTNVNDTQEKRKTDLLINKYYPKVAEALSLFVSEMMEYYISKLDQHGIFDYSKVKGYDLQRSSDLLKNITLVSDKTKLLKEAFTYCPYNPDVYNVALENGLADIPTFETAKYFMQDRILTDAIYNFIRENINNYSLIDLPLEILAMYNHQEKETLYEEMQKEIYITKILSLLEKQKNKIENEQSILHNYEDEIKKLEADVHFCYYLIPISIIVFAISSPLTIWSWNNSSHGELGLAILFFFFISLVSIICCILGIQSIINSKDKLRLARLNLKKHKNSIKA